MSFKFWLGIIMCYGADIRMKPGPQRGTLVIGTRACAKSIRFFVSEKIKVLIFCYAFYLRHSGSETHTKYSSLLSCDVY